MKALHEPSARNKSFDVSARSFMLSIEVMRYNLYQALLRYYADSPVALAAGNRSHCAVP